MSLFRQHAAPCAFPADESWVILSPIEAAIKRKIEAVGTPLSQWDIHIYRGVLTGCNDAFIIPTARRNEILAACRDEAERERTAELIRPILRGRDIKRYGYEWAELWLIATFPSRHYDIEQYPAVRDYLLSFGREKLEQTGATYTRDGQEFKARKKTNNQWFETQDSISYWEDFEKPKIIYMDIQTDNPEEGYPFPCFSYDSEGSIILNTAYMICSEKRNPKYILGILNSRLGRFFIKLNVIQLQKRQFRMFTQDVERFPVAIPSAQQEEEIVQLVDTILSTKSKDVELRLDQHAYQIYGLSPEEINFIERRSHH